MPVPRLISRNEPLLQNLANKWSSVVFWNGSSGNLQPNHQLLVIGDAVAATQPDATGLTMSLVPGQTSSYVFRGTIEDVVSSTGTGNAADWAKKTAAHEIAHQWESNATWGLFDHCPATTTAFDNAGLYCLLAQADDARSGTQRSNGIARFHLLPVGNAWHSEYLEIRRRSDPFVP